MNKALNIKWLYVICIALLIAFAVTLIPSLFSFADSFDAIARITSVALYVVTAIILALIVVFAVRYLLKICKSKN